MANGGFSTAVNIPSLPGDRTSVYNSSSLESSAKSTKEVYSFETVTATVHASGLLIVRLDFDDICVARKIDWMRQLERKLHMPFIVVNYHLRLLFTIDELEALVGRAEEVLFVRGIFQV